MVGAAGEAAGRGVIFPAPIPVTLAEGLRRAALVALALVVVVALVALVVRAPVMPRWSYVQWEMPATGAGCRSPGRVKGAAAVRCGATGPRRCACIAAFPAEARQ